MAQSGDDDPVVPYGRLDNSTAESTVTIHIDPAKTKLKRNEYVCSIAMFWCGCTLRTGCIVVASMYLVYSCAFLVIAFSVLDIIDFRQGGPSHYVGPILTPYTDIFCAIVGFVIVAFLLTGVGKRSPYYIHVGKWLMIVDCGLAMFELIQIAIWGIGELLSIHLILQVVPIYFIIIINSYEGQLLSDIKMIEKELIASARRREVSEQNDSQRSPETITSST